MSSSTIACGSAVRAISGAAPEAARRCWPRHIVGQVQEPTAARLRVPHTWKVHAQVDDHDDSPVMTANRLSSPANRASRETSLPVSRLCSAARLAGAADISATPCVNRVARGDAWAVHPRSARVAYLKVTSHVLAASATYPNNDLPCRVALQAGSSNTTWMTRVICTRARASHAQGAMLGRGGVGHRQVNRSGLQHCKCRSVKAKAGIPAS